jgi:nitroreductase
MDLINLIRRRRSVRRFQDKMPVKSQIMELLESARFAHSLGNNQPLRYVVSTNQVVNQEVFDASNMAFIHELGTESDIDKAAPIYIAVYAPRGASPALQADLGASFQNMALTAVAQDLNMYWLHSFDEFKLSSLLGIPTNKQVLALFALGYPAEKAEAYNADQKTETIDDKRRIRVPKLRVSQISSWID